MNEESGNAKSQDTPCDRKRPRHSYTVQVTHSKLSKARMGAAGCSFLIWDKSHITRCRDPTSFDKPDIDFSLLLLYSHQPHDEVIRTARFMP